MREKNRILVAVGLVSLVMAFLFDGPLAWLFLAVAVVTLVIAVVILARRWVA